MVQPAIFHRSARQVIRTFPADVKRSLGKAIWELQQGAQLGAPLSKPMPAIAPGVQELRVKDASGAYRAFYFTRSTRGVLVLHAFMKKHSRHPHATSLSRENI